jgi:phosphatidate cytidylyltransferase
MASQGSTRWSDLGIRVASAAVLAPVALICIWLGGPAFDALVALAGVCLAVEWVQMCRERPLGWPASLVPAGVLLASLLGANALEPQAGAVLAIAMAFVLLTAVRSKAALAAGVPYVGMGVLAILWLRHDPSAGRDNLLFLLFLIWASDIGAYLTGRLVGGPKLAPAISPGKTWSGAAGGLVACVAVGWLAAAIMHPPVAPLRLVPLAVGLGVVAQAGDLLESWVKRRFGVKDSGRLIPGHGGLLDRLDALMTAAPVAALLALLAGRGVVLWQ